jgi:NAD(P)-dependent dehydrogenase (short-subunit alcohol dehydrogenase family)
MQTERSFLGQTFLVTGATSGLGAHFCAALKARGASVIGLARRDCSGQPGVDLSIEADISDAAALEAAVVHAIGLPGAARRIDGVINNAGIAVTATLEQTSPVAEARVLATNISGVTNMTRTLVPYLRAQGGGLIVNMASVLGILPVKQVATYAATKAAIIQMTRSAAIELARDHIRVNALAPGYVRTELNGEVLDGPAGESLKKMTPLRRFARPDELEAPLFFLLDPSNTYMTGAVLVVDGGMSAGL